MDALESERKRLRKGVQQTCVVRLPANILAPTRPSHEQKARVTCEMAEAFAEDRERETQRNSNTNRATRAAQTEAEFEIARATIGEMDSDGDKTHTPRYHGHDGITTSSDQGFDIQ